MKEELTTAKRVVKTCKDLKEAEQHLERLYDKYESVQLVQFPKNLVGNGTYIWMVHGELD